MQLPVSTPNTGKPGDAPLPFSILNIFKRDYFYHGGVPRINVFLLRLLFTLMFFFLGYDAWSYIIKHKGPWDPVQASAWCMWAGYAAISIIGIVRPLKMLPIILFEIVYKITWLAFVAYPLWAKNELEGSPVEYTANVFIFVLLPVCFMPWRYFFRVYILGKSTA